MQSSVIMTSQPWGLGLEEKLLPEKLKDLGYKSHLVGKVFYLTFAFTFRSIGHIKYFSGRLKREEVTSVIDDYHLKS